MGNFLKKDLALEAGLIVAVLNAIDEKVLTAVKAKNPAQRDRWIIAGAYLSISYVLSLRGNEGFMMDIKELLKNRPLKKGLVWIVLSGILKGESVPMLHQLRSVPTTDSGVEVKLWRDRLIFVHEQAGRVEGPATCDKDGLFNILFSYEQIVFGKNGYLLSFSAMNKLFW